MTERESVKPVYQALRQYLRSREDIGVAKAICDGVLEPANPFDPKDARPPRRWFVLFLLLAAMAFGCFIYFNNLL